MAGVVLFNDPTTAVTYTLSLHDALPIYAGPALAASWLIRMTSAARPDRCRQGRAIMISLSPRRSERRDQRQQDCVCGDRKSTRLNSSHMSISYAVFCLKKKCVRECLHLS